MLYLRFEPWKRMKSHSLLTIRINMYGRQFCCFTVVLCVQFVVLFYSFRWMNSRWALFCEYFTESPIHLFASSEAVGSAPIQQCRKAQKQKYFPSLHLSKVRIKLLKSSTIVIVSVFSFVSFVVYSILCRIAPRCFRAWWFYGIIFLEMFGKKIFNCFISVILDIRMYLVFLDVHGDKERERGLRISRFLWIYVN